MNPALLALRRAEQRLVARLDELEAEIAAGQASAPWTEFAAVAAALAAIVPTTTPDAAGQLLTIAELAKRCQLSERTIRRKVRAGEIKPVLGARGRGAVRFPAGAAR